MDTWLFDLNERLLTARNRNFSNLAPLINLFIFRRSFYLLHDYRSHL